MIQSIEQVEESLENGQSSLTELLFLRRKLNAPFRLHPLGFIVCTLLVEGSRKLRLHYWPANGGAKQSTECQIHDHRFEFKSWVLFGTVANIEYVPSSNGTEYALYRTQYLGDRSILTMTGTTLRLAEQRREMHAAGSSYIVAANVLHETIRVGCTPAFTILLTKDVSAEAPLVLGSPHGVHHYEYERKIVPEKIVEEMLAAYWPPGFRR